MQKRYFYYQILDDRGVIILEGKDALKFIQNFSTNDIAKIDFTYNYLLNNQGRYLYDFFACRANDQMIFLDCDKRQIKDLVARLNLYKLRSDVIISDESDNFAIMYSKESLSDVLTRNLEFEYSLQDPRHDKLGYRSLVKLYARSAESDYIDTNMYNAENILAKKIPDLYLIDKYELSIIDGCIDLISERSIPIEFAGEEQYALSFTKGCYVGQEVISRAKHQGVVRKKIYKLDFGKVFGADSELNSEIDLSAEDASSFKSADVMDNSGNKIGKICSGYRNLAIAQIYEEKLFAAIERDLAPNIKSHQEAGQFLQQSGVYQVIVNGIAGKIFCIS